MTKSSIEETLIEVWRQALVENTKAVELGAETYPVRRTPKRGLRQVDFVFDGNEIRGLEQNPDTKSRWAQLPSPKDTHAHEPQPSGSAGPQIVVVVVWPLALPCLYGSAVSTFAGRFALLKALRLSFGALPRISRAHLPPPRTTLGKFWELTNPPLQVEFGLPVVPPTETS